MDRYKTKKHILESAISKHQSLIDSFRKRIKEMQEGEEHIGENAVDIQSQSLNEEADKFINRIADQLNAARDKMAILYNLRGDNVAYKEAVPGAVVVTDKATFFLSTGIEKFKMDGREIIPLSTESPLYQCMAGKKKGEKFKYGKVTYTINRIY